MRFKTIPLILTILLLLSVSSVFAQEEPVVIEILEGPTWHEDIVSTFNETHPNIEVKRTEIPGDWEDYERKVLTMATGGELPEVVVFQDEPFPAYAARGIFKNLDPFLERDEDIQEALAEDRFLPGALSAFQFDSETGNIGSGHQYGMSFGWGEVLLQVNETMFDDSGVPYPEEDWTWDDLLTISQKLTKKDDNNKITQYGFAIPGWWLYSWMPFIWSNGGDFYNEDKTASVFDSSQNVETLQFLYDMVNKYEVSPSPVASAQVGMGPGEMFDAGDIAMNPDGPWAVGGTHEASREEGYEWDIYPGFPPNKAGEEYRQTRMTCDGLVMSADAEGKKAEAAWEFIKWVTVLEGQKVVAETGTMMPAMENYALSEVWADPETPFSEEAFVEGMDHARLQPVTLKWPEFNEELQKQADLLLTGSQTSEQTVEKTHDIINSLCEKNRKLLEDLQE